MYHLRMSRLREARKRAGLTQEELAERAGIVQSVVSRAEKGSSIAEESLAKIAAVLGVSADELRPEGGDVPPSTASHVYEHSRELEDAIVEELQARKAAAWGGAL